MTHWASRNLVGAWCPSVSGWGGTLLRDLSGNGNHGTLTNMTPATDWVVSGGYYALDLDTTSRHVNAPHSSSLNLERTWTFSIWIKLNENPLDEDIFLGKAFDGATVPYYLTVVSDKFSAASFDGSNNYNASSTTLVSSVLNQWIHIVGGRNASQFFIAVNGVVEATATTALSAAITSTTSFQIGRAGLANRQAAISFDDCKLYNRVLTASEIRLLSSERGYGLRPERDRRYGFLSATSNRRRRLICGAPV